MDLVEKVGIKGRCTLISHEASDKVKLLQELQKMEWKGSYRMTNEERDELDKAEVQKVTINNLTMTRGIDFMVSLFGRAVGFGLDTLFSDDRNSINNSFFGLLQVNAAAYAQTLSTIWIPALFPEVIGIGNSLQAPSLTDAGLINDFNSTVSRPDNISFRNTYNNKIGGWRGYGSTYPNDYISQYAAIYESGESADYLNNLESPIYEVGLFTPEIHVGYYPVDPVGVVSGNINFNNDNVGLETNNRLWSALNVSAIHTQGAVPVWEKFSRGRATILGVEEGFESVRGSELISLPNVAGIALGGWRAIVAFTPRYDSVASAAGTWGTDRAFTPSQLVARIVLPEGFLKSSNYTLTVIWQIYTSRFN